MSRHNGLPGYDAWITREPDDGFPDHNDGSWCDNCFAYGELKPAVDHFGWDGEGEYVCDQCLERARERYMDPTIGNRAFPYADNE